jgi:hypothetical protein
MWLDESALSADATSGQDIAEARQITSSGIVWRQEQGQKYEQEPDEDGISARIYITFWLH